MASSSASGTERSSLGARRTNGPGPHGSGPFASLLATCSVVTTVPARFGALFGNTTRIDGSSPGAADPTATEIAFAPPHLAPPKNPPHTSGSIASDGAVTSIVGP